MGNYVFDSSEKKKKNQTSRFIFNCENLYLTTQVNLNKKNQKENFKIFKNRKYKIKMNIKKNFFTI
jgi:hypothetical protein